MSRALPAWLRAMLRRAGHGDGQVVAVLRRENAQLKRLAAALEDRLAQLEGRPRQRSLR